MLGLMLPTWMRPSTCIPPEAWVPGLGRGARVVFQRLMIPRVLFIVIRHAGGGWPWVCLGSAAFYGSSALAGFLVIVMGIGLTQALAVAHVSLFFGLAVDLGSAAGVGKL